jgi:hypothetical protein
MPDETPTKPSGDACPVCGKAIAAGDVVTSTSKRQRVHVRCWTPGMAKDVAPEEEEGEGDVA